MAGTNIAFKILPAYDKSRLTEMQNLEYHNNASEVDYVQARKGFFSYKQSYFSINGTIK